MRVLILALCLLTVAPAWAQSFTGVWSRAQRAEVVAQVGVSSYEGVPLALSPGAYARIPIGTRFDLSVGYRHFVTVVSTRTGNRDVVRPGNLALTAMWIVKGQTAGTAALPFESNRFRLGFGLALPIGSLVRERGDATALSYGLAAILGQTGAYSPWLTSYQSVSAYGAADYDHHAEHWIAGLDFAAGGVVAAYNGLGDGTGYLITQLGGYAGWSTHLQTDISLAIGSRLQLVASIPVGGRPEGQFAIMPFARLAGRAADGSDFWHTELALNVNLDKPFGPSFFAPNPYGVLLSCGFQL